MTRATWARLAVVAVGLATLGCGRLPFGRRPGATNPTPDTAGSGDAMLLGGANGTVFNASSKAYGAPMPSLSEDELARHLRGDALFEAKFVPGRAPVHGGLGPRFNNLSCSGCHLNEGRGAPTFSTSTGANLLVMISLPADDARAAAVAGEREQAGVIPVPGIGVQVQDHATSDSQAHAQPQLNWVEESGTFSDGTAYHLRRPIVTLGGIGGRPLDARLAAPLEMSIRQPQPVIGLGLLEAVSDDDLQALARDRSKVSGHLNQVWSRERQGPAIGRFNRKAGKSTIREQAAKAFNLDMGLTTDLFPLEAGEEVSHPIEISAADLSDLEFYLRTLAVPARRSLDDQAVRAGEALFAAIGCPACHTRQLTTGSSDIAALAHQTIHPYTDLLLHDMGEGLADHRGEFTATGREWRTAPLWGIGLAQTVRPYATYLHDGRARSLEEAILWHGGQAEPFREAFRNLSASDRDALIRFLGSL